MNEKLEALRAMLEDQQRARLAADGMHSLLEASYGDTYRAKIKPGRKYCNVDFGGSGKYMVELSTGAIFGIKAYGVIHRGHQYGTLDTIAEWDWSGYTATKRKAAKQCSGFVPLVNGGDFRGTVCCCCGLSEIAHAAEVPA